MTGSSDVALQMATLNGAETPVPYCSLRRAATQDRFAQDSFDFSIPVLQWAGSFSESEWHRHQNAPPPYGWGGLPAFGSALSLLNNASSSRLFERGSRDQCVTCAVVGNGGILRGSGQGQAIDSHHFVFRVNGAITKGFEEDVGSRTSFYGFTTNTLKHSLKAYHWDGFREIPRTPDIRYIFIPVSIRDYVMLTATIQGTTVPSGEDKGDWPSKYFGYKPPTDKFRMLHPHFIQYVTKRFLNSPLLNMRYGNLYRPSTGALMLLTALHTCDKVSAYGFITRNYGDFSDHYYDSVKKPLHFYANHDLLMESWLWEFLHWKKLIWLYQRYSRG
ncbi:alpha-N-acetylgalactosaminide alpha-2,6-sialyltransferase 2 [Chanos chanos]|uniref:alpha-N-acetylgalactosaminide alpha-2,6-sialyltransferase n=1 Tax=Chanos chanos TaxID=29144 RepID=A0A6J2WJ18_CHACN|nr:alpha-N-acetylgalactosaminide alpha-2,6-sialyltransferase 2 [Chanos chanos]